MKKLILMLLLVVGGVMTASAKTIYVENTIGWDKMYLYAWTGDNKNGSWPGILLTQKEKIDDKDVYTVDLGEYENFILVKADKDDKTGDCSSKGFSDGAYYYVQPNDNNYQDCQLHKMTLYSYNFTATTTDAWNNFYIYLFYNEQPLSDGWPGKKLDGTSNVYTYTYKTFKNAGATIGVIFNKGDGQHQTNNLSANTGNNNYVLKDGNNSISLVEKVVTNSSGFCTFTNTNPLTISDAIAYTAEDKGDGKALLHSVTDPAAGTAMLIKGDASTTYYFEVVASGTDYTSNNAFKAGPVTGLASQDGSNYNYVLNGNTFYAANGKNVGEGKAYLQLSSNGQAPARADLIFPEEGTTTTVNTISAVKENDNTVYNVQGVKVANPTKGLYIKNGKKYFVK